MNILLMVNYMILHDIINNNYYMIGPYIDVINGSNEPDLGVTVVGR